MGHGLPIKGAVGAAAHRAGKIGIAAREYTVVALTVLRGAAGAASYSGVLVCGDAGAVRYGAVSEKEAAGAGAHGAGGLVVTAGAGERAVGTGARRTTARGSASDR